MAEWLYEAGIGEDRAALVEDGRIRIARIERHDGAPRVGAVLPARLTDIVETGRTGIVALAGGGEALLAPLPPALTQGGTLPVEIVRAALPERGRAKRAKAVPAVIGAVERDGPDLLARISAGDHRVRRLHPHEADELEAAGWSEVLEEAETGEVAFAGGALRIALTPAMTLIDIDGQPPLERLAVAGAEAAARAILRLGIAGSVGLDLPTIAGKAERQAAAAAIDAVLPPPFERTAMNGFGFVQIIRPRRRLSLPEVVQTDLDGTALRAILRRLERTPPPGVRSCALPPRLLGRLAAHPEWTAALHRRSGVATAFVPIQETR